MTTLKKIESLIDRIESYSQRMDISKASEADRLLFELLFEHSTTLMVHAMMLSAGELARVALSDHNSKLAAAAASNLAWAIDASVAMDGHTKHVDCASRLRALSGMPFGRMQ